MNPSADLASRKQNKEITQVRTDSSGSLTRIVMENGSIRVVVVPSLGGKIASIVNLATGREFILQPRRKYTQPSYGSEFSQFDRSGFDECFPTISKCTYPADGLPSVRLPDHGEVWSVAWKHEIHGGDLWLATEGVRLPYVFQKRLSLIGSSLQINYQVRNVGDRDFNFLWSAHPLLAAEEGMCIVLPREVRELFVNSSEDERIGRHGEVCTWPKAVTRTGNSVTLDKTEGPASRTAEKLFTSRVDEGRCGVFFPSTTEALIFRFDPNEIPFIGLWICQGAWPSKQDGDFTVALEPCNGRPDSLEEAIARDECATLCRLGQNNWCLTIELASGAQARNSLGISE